MIGLEEHAKRYGKLHPEVIAVLNQFMRPPWLPEVYDPKNINVIILPPTDPILNPPSASRPVAGVVDARNLRDIKLVFAQGALNRQGWVRDNQWDLVIPEGWWAFAHECHHVWRMPRMSFWERIAYFFQVLFHRKITIEDEATEFGGKVKEYINPQQLTVFNDLRGNNGSLPLYPDRPGDMLA